MDKTDHNNVSEGHMPPKLNRRKTAQRTTVKMVLLNRWNKRVDGWDVKSKNNNNSERNKK